MDPGLPGPKPISGAPVGKNTFLGLFLEKSGTEIWFSAVGGPAGDSLLRLGVCFRPLGLGGVPGASRDSTSPVGLTCEGGPTCGNWGSHRGSPTSESHIESHMVFQSHRTGLSFPCFVGLSESRGTHRSRVVQKRPRGRCCLGSGESPMTGESHMVFQSPMTGLSPQCIRGDSSGSRVPAQQGATVFAPAARARRGA